MRTNMDRRREGGLALQFEEYSKRGSQNGAEKYGQELTPRTGGMVAWTSRTSRQISPIPSGEDSHAYSISQVHNID